MSLASTTVLTVSQLTYQIKNQLESQFAHLIVQGEVTNCKPTSSGHIYFDLKDAGAKVPAVMFKGKTGSLARPLKEGDQIVAKGTLSVYAPQGRYQLIVESLEYKGIGELLLKLEELKKKLKERGWFAIERKKPIPKFPKKIGVVTSPTGAVIKDILHVLSRRYKGFHLILNPVKVQGIGAAEEIAKAINELNKHNLVDVIIVARGGGSLEDLWPFNEEIVASAIFSSAIPVISAVGHETDFTIADFVADVRAPTPSAAAEIVISEKMNHLQFLKKMEKGIGQALLHLVSKHRAALQAFARHPLLSNPYLLVGNLMQKMDEMEKKLNQRIFGLLREKGQLVASKKKVLIAQNPSAKITFLKNSLLQYKKRLDFLEKNFLMIQRKKVVTIRDHLFSLDPKNVLKRGYSILFAQKNDSVIVSTRNINLNDKICALLSDGKLTLQINEISEEIDE